MWIPGSKRYAQNAYFEKINKREANATPLKDIIVLIYNQERTQNMFQQPDFVFVMNKLNSV